MQQDNYNQAVKITDVQDLGDVMINQLTDLFVEKNKKTSLKLFNIIINTSVNFFLY